MDKVGLEEVLKELKGLTGPEKDRVMKRAVDSLRESYRNGQITQDFYLTVLENLNIIILSA